MASSDKSAGPDSPTDAETDVSLAGWDPYIVGLTGAPGHDATGKSAVNATAEIVDGRKIQLMAWLHEHNR